MVFVMFETPIDRRWRWISLTIMYRMYLDIRWRLTILPVIHQPLNVAETLRIGTSKGSLDVFTYITTTILLMKSNAISSKGKYVIEATIMCEIWYIEEKLN